MKIGVDLSITQINQAGSAIYARSLVDALSDLHSGDDYLVFSVNHQRNMASQKTWRSRLDTLYRDLVWTHVALPLKVRRAETDILHMPANVIPMIAPCATIVTILDTTIFQSPRHFTPWHRFSSQLFIPLSAKRATTILTISEQSKRDIVRRFNVAPDKVVVTYLAVSPKFQCISDQAAGEVKQRYALNDFILTVGTLEPRKNISRLLRAFAALRQRGLQHQLVHAGPPGWLYSDVLAEAKCLGLEDVVRFLGRVPVDDLVKLYNAASVFVYPSLYEGFGLPPLEAMNCGCPVITSNVSSLPEVVGDAAMLVDPYNTKQLTDTMQAVLENQALAETLRQKGLDRAGMFSWERCARETVTAYQHVYRKAKRLE